MKTSNHRSQITDHRSQITDHRSQITTLFSLVILLPLLLFNSCSDKESVPSDTEVIPARILMQKVKKDAIAEWQAFLRNLPDERPDILQYRDGEGEMQCNCSYLIEDVQVQTPPGHDDIEIDFFSSDCDPNNPFGCAYFSSLYFSGPVCGGFINPECESWWSTLPPEDAIDFNCPVPAYSSFPATFATIYIDPDCSGWDVESWSVTFRIRCQDSPPDPKCGNGLGYGYVSEPITLFYPDPGNPTGNPNYGTAIIDLTGCGCVPVEHQ